MVTHKAKIASQRRIQVPKQGKVVFPIGRVGDIVHEIGYRRLHHGNVLLPMTTTTTTTAAATAKTRTAAWCLIVIRSMGEKRAKPALLRS